MEQKIPEVLQDAAGAVITDRKVWEQQRGRIYELLCDQEYGFLPPPPEQISFRTVERQEDFCASKAVYERVEIRVQVSGKEFAFPVDAVVPAVVSEKPMAFVHINFRSNVPDEYMPSEELADGGFAVFSFGYEDVTKDNRDFSDGLAALFPAGSRNGNAPGKIALWAWAALRVMDYLQTREDVDLKNVAVVGHSRLGKTALLAAASDERFAFAISNDSGCSGAAVTRGKKGERVADITKMFPYWFCENYKAYAGREEEMPFDQHFLLALIAPRKLYVSSAQEDQWADPPAELAGCRAASPVYGLYGLGGLVCGEESPEANAVFPEGNIGYHVRKGTHYLSRYDWQRFMEYLRLHRN